MLLPMLLKTWNCQTQAIWLVTSIAMFAIASNKAMAQITPDNSLGSERSVVTPTTIKDVPSDRIDGGAIRGVNLFHSFLEFNIKSGRGAYFAIPNAGIDNVLTRVTGNNPSDISGKLGILGNSPVNLFLLNPNGIIFGQKASLDVGGSFVATTADEIEFGDRGSFSATNPTSPGLLTINPSALLFNQMATQRIENRAILAVPNGESLLLAGGDIDLKGGKLSTLGGNIGLTSLSSLGKVDLSFGNNQLSLGLPTGMRGDVNIRNSQLNANDDSIGQIADSSGEIAIYAGNLDVFNSGISGITTKKDGGDIRFDISDRMSLQGEGTFVFSASLGESAGGDITINSGQLLLKDGANILLGNFGSNDGGDITITTGKLLVTNGSFVLTSTFGSGDGGTLTIETGQLLVTNGIVSASTFGSGNGGNLQVTATDRIELRRTSANSQSRSGLFTNADSLSTEEGRAGNLTITVKTGQLLVTGGAFISASTSSSKDAGDITITAGQLLVTNGSQISTATFGSGDPAKRSGNGGNLRVNADRIELRGTSADGQDVSGLFTQSEPGFTKNAGDLTVDTRQLFISNGAQVSSSTFGSGDGGNLQVQADRIEIRGTSVDGDAPSGLFTRADSGSTGEGTAGNLTIRAGQMFVTDGAIISASTNSSKDAGNLTITTGQLFVTNGAQISAFTAGSGNGGNLRVNADRIELRGTSADGETFSGLFTNADSRSTREGRAGNLTIDSRQIFVTDGAVITASTDSAKDAGDLTITTGQLFVTNGAVISSASLGTGDAGNIRLEADSANLDNGTIAAFTRSGEGGNLTFEISDLLLLDNNSFISTTAGGTGNGGNMAIDTRFLVAVDDSDITANAFEGNGGNINITAQGIFRSVDSDITASSQLGIDGSVQFNTPDIDPSRGLVNLPSDVVDASRQIYRTCYRPTSSGNPSQFIITGRGGLPATLGETTSQEQSLVGLVSPVSPSATESTVPPCNSKADAPLPIEAQGWIVDGNGEIYLVAQMPNASPPGSQLPNETCDRTLGLHFYTAN
jgi:filamentous hemagglutinin family protein